MWFKIQSKILKYLEKIRIKNTLTYWELSEQIWIGRATFYRMIKDKRASAWTIKKLKEFLKSNWYDVE